MSITSHAVVMTAYGPPEVLSYCAVTQSELGETEVRIRTIAAAINHTLRQRFLDFVNRWISA